MPDKPPRTNTTWVSQPNPTLYSPKNIARYGDLIVGKAHRWAWKLDNNFLQDLYLLHVSDRHLEIGPGDLHFLDHTPAPALEDQWQVDVLDINRAPLETAEQKLSGRAQVNTHEHDILALPWPTQAHHFRSLAIGNVLHCLPGAGFDAKKAAIRGMADALADDGVAWGYTLPGAQDSATRTNLLARILMWRHNHADNVFCNRGDRYEDLERVLGAHFAWVRMTIMGSGVAFVVREPIR